MDAVVARLVQEVGLEPPLEAPAGIEVVRREGDGRSFLFLLNHGAQDATVELDRTYREVLTGDECSGTLRLDPFGVAVLRAP
jgi:beta-galactosidase